MLIIKQLMVAYGSDPVIESLDLNIESSRVHGIVGLNGAGKTTLFHAIYGTVKSKKGTITWNDKPLSRKDISLLETQNFFYSNITGREYLELFKAHSKSINLEIWQDLFKLPLDELIDNYSTGMKKKLAFLGVLKMDKPIILLDEPFNGIDMEASIIIRLLLKKLKERKKTIIVSSHILETLTSTCDYIHYIEDKKIKKTYKKEELDKMDRDIVGEIESQTSNRIDEAI